MPLSKLIDNLSEGIIINVLIVNLVWITCGALVSTTRIRKLKMKS